MSDDLISRQAVIDWYCKWECNSKYCGIPCREVEEMQGLPSAEPQKGEWIETKIWGGRNYSCSCCRFEFNVDTVMLQPTWHYCPNCGAKMITDKDDTQ